MTLFELENQVGDVDGAVERHISVRHHIEGKHEIIQVHCGFTIDGFNEPPQLRIGLRGFYGTSGDCIGTNNLGFPASLCAVGA